MVPLFERLSRPLPRLALGAFPSPLEDRPDLARALGAGRLLLKRDDRNGPVFGGNKLRALEFLLPAAGPAPVTIGGYGSTWCAALAEAGAAAGCRPHVALFPQPWTEVVAGMLRATQAGAAVTLARSQLALPWAVARAWRAARRHAGARPRWIPPGGAAPLGVVGSVNAALEFVGQVEAGGGPRPGAVVVPLGSGGTAAGLLLGFDIAGWDTMVCAVRVATPFTASGWNVRRLARRAGRLLRAHGLEPCRSTARLRVIGNQLGPGYGHRTGAAEAARESFAAAGVALDLCYSAKAAAALRDLADSFPHLTFWHTFDRRLATRLTDDPPLLAAARHRAESLWPHPKST